jgi:hypothetical protein
MAYSFCCAVFDGGETSDALALEFRRMPLWEPPPPRAFYLCRSEQISNADSKLRDEGSSTLGARQNSLHMKQGGSFCME